MKRTSSKKNLSSSSAAATSILWPSVNIEAGKFTPYSAVVFFSLGLLVSNFLWNSLVMAKPFTGDPVKYGDYFKGSAKLHMIGILRGVIWSVGMSFSIIASGAAGFAISYGLGQRATMTDYPAFVEQGYDIGSGPSESFCGCLTNRLKGSGMRWDKDNAEAMGLASLYCSN